ncbi:hypothetical protein SLS55_009628 [Diplodia seriata]|uniref:Zn(2)-C6 fungal-type domain-containing protein n=1 Tax=Diplodia seriata TaxID=420778 RepID=A0ABR3C6F7_9PEZI
MPAPTRKTSNKRPVSSAPSPAAGLARTEHARTEYARTQIADQPRIPWHWSADKCSAPYTPVVRDKWWSDLLDIPLNRTNANRRRVVTNACRIMELELGEQKLGDARCDSCRARGFECWVYSREGAAQVSKPGDACARCRVRTQKGGCSLSKRKKNARHYKRKRRGGGGGGGGGDGGGDGGDGGRSPTPPKRPPPPLRPRSMVPSDSVAFAW